MGSTTLREDASVSRANLDDRRLYVAWQNKASRAIEPVGRLDRLRTNGEVIFEFRYLRRAMELHGFRAFLSFPDPRRIYRSTRLFPFFENRLMPRSRTDYPAFMHLLGLDDDADPFEVLARSEGRRQTDNIEVFPEPILDEDVVRCRFLVHGVRHVPGAEEAVASLAIGDRLSVMPDPQNPDDCRAVLVRDGNFHLLGWVPRYLTELIHRPLTDLGPNAVDVTVDHVGPRDGPIHLRLLCGLQVRWPQARAWPFRGPEFGVINANTAD